LAWLAFDIQKARQNLFFARRIHNVEGIFEYLWPRRTINLVQK